MSENNDIPTPLTDAIDNAWNGNKHLRGPLVPELFKHARIFEKKLATVTKELTDTKVNLIEANRAVGMKSARVIAITLRCSGLHAERDAIRTEVERLKLLNAMKDATIEQRTAEAKLATAGCVAWAALHKGNNPAPAQSEPSQVGGKVNPSWDKRSFDATLWTEFEDPKNVASLKSELATAQTTIAEQAALLTQEVEYADRLRTENAALRAERGKLKSDMGEGEWADILRIVNERDNAKAQLATAIAERDEAQQELVTTLAINEHMQNDFIGALTKVSADKLKSERDSALAACAAKDVALRKAYDLLPAPGTNSIQFEGVIMEAVTPEFLDEALGIIQSALSPTVGSDYVPKAPMVKLRNAIKAAMFELSTTGRVQSSHDMLMDALTAAAPFLK